MAKDMTRGNIVKTLISFSLPLILSGLLQQLYNWADAFIVGNIEGELSLAAIGATNTISSLFIMVITGFTLGLSILSAQKYGSGETDSLKKILSSFVAVFTVVFLFIGILGIFISGPILSILHTPKDIFEIAKSYLQIIMVGIPFLTIYNVYSAVLRGMGDSKAPFLSVVISAITNVFLDIIFVAVFHYGAVGAAIATTISQILMAVFIVCYTIKKYSILRFKIKRDIIDRHYLKQGIQLGLPPAIQFNVSSFGNLVLQNFMNGFGTQTVAAITTAYRVDSIILLPIINLGSGISTVVAQNVGAGNKQRSKKTFFVGTIMMSVISVILTILVISFGGNLIALFGITKESVIIGTNFFHSIAWFYLVFGFAMSVRGYLEGIGDVLFSSLAGIVSLVIRIIMSYTLVSKYDNMIIAYAEAFSWGILLLIYIPRFLHKLKGSNNMMENNEEFSEGI